MPRAAAASPTPAPRTRTGEGEMRGTGKGLTERQRRFVEEYQIDGNATQAAIRAGYSKRTANEQGARLLANVSVAAALDAARAARSERLDLTADWVLERLRENVDRAMQAEPVRDREGNETGEYVYAGAVANKALELLGKHLGLFTDRVDVTSGGKPLNPADLSDDDLAALAAGVVPPRLRAGGEAA